jgi:D-sedoheptulose 7-phosphate isomerase
VSTRPGPATVAASTREIVERYREALAAALAGVDPGAVEAVVECLRRARDRGATVYVAGNGGSAATATHWANDLGKAAKRSGARPIRVMCLSDNTSWMTALANDEGYERVFAGQLENFAQPGDVLAVISASGNSPNLLEAVRLASTTGMETIALVGFDGGALLSMVTHPVWVASPTGEYGLVETAHAAIADMVTTCLMSDAGGEAP